MTSAAPAATPKNGKAEYQIDVQVQTALLDKVYTKTRQRIREKGGMITHNVAMQLVLKEDLQKIKEELFNEHLDDIAKTDPLLAENLRSKDPKAREEGMRILDMMIQEMESPD
jgi:hypothetical protein